MPRNIAASKIGNGVISLLWQLRCHCIPDHDKFSSLSNKIFQMFVYGNAVTLRIGRYWPWKTVSISNHLHMPVRPMPCCIVWPSFLFDCTFLKNLGNFWEFFAQMVYRPHWQKISRTPMNLSRFLSPSWLRANMAKLASRYREVFGAISNLWTINNYCSSPNGLWVNSPWVLWDRV